MIASGVELDRETVGGRSVTLHAFDTASYGDDPAELTAAECRELASELLKAAEWLEGNDA